MARIGSAKALLSADDIEWATLALGGSDRYDLAPEPALGPTVGMISSDTGFVLDDPDPDGNDYDDDDDDDDDDVFPDDEEDDDREDDSDDDHDL